MKTIALAIAATLLGASHAQAQQQSACGPYETIVAALASEYKEAPVARMLSDRGFVIEILASPDGATFTVLAVNPDMKACGLATGSGFSLLPLNQPAAPAGPPA